jgi:2-polyprenyl-3-methyl-5-hydroxy-6-metoxy-1,4-benzoquinol methylase
MISWDNAAMEWYQSSDQQRGRSVRFEWSEDHDFGDFEVKGMSQNRSTWLISMFMDKLPVLPRDLTGKRVLDIGCWTGGTSLILAQMGASVVAIEEVKKYVDCLEYLCESFGVSNLEPRNLSLYDLTGDEFQDAFDIVLFGGVLYHLSDPVLGARITFDTLRDHGTCLLETAVARSKDRILEYAGKDEPGRGTGANWFFPAPNVVHAIMDEVGYRNIRSVLCPQTVGPHDRMVAVGTKVGQVDMLRAGLSVHSIR